MPEWEGEPKETVSAFHEGGWVTPPSASSTEALSMPRNRSPIEPLFISSGHKESSCCCGKGWRAPISSRRPPAGILSRRKKGCSKNFRSQVISALRGAIQFSEWEICGLNTALIAAKFPLSTQHLLILLRLASRRLFVTYRVAVDGIVFNKKHSV